MLCIVFQFTNMEDKSIFFACLLHLVVVPRMLCVYLVTKLLKLLKKITLHVMKFRFHFKLIFISCFPSKYMYQGLCWHYPFVWSIPLEVCLLFGVFQYHIPVLVIVSQLYKSTTICFWYSRFSLSWLVYRKEIIQITCVLYLIWKNLLCM